MFNRNALKAAMALRGVTGKDLAKEIGCDQSTLYRKMDNDGSFTRKEINAIISYLRIADPKAIFFADELTETQGGDK